MPKEIITRTWECSICGSPAQTFEEAAECERTHFEIEETKYVYFGSTSQPDKVIIVFANGTTKEYYG